MPDSKSSCHSERSEESYLRMLQKQDPSLTLRMTEKTDDPATRVRLLLEEAIAGASTVAILGCGSPLRGDDAAGSLIASNLADLSDRSNGRARAFYGEVAPENLMGPIKEYNPDLLLIIDAADMACEPGEVRIISANEVGGISFSTHLLPLPILMQYLESEIGCRTLLLGIQIANIEFMAGMTPAVTDAVETVTMALRALLTQGST